MRTRAREGLPMDLRSTGLRDLMRQGDDYTLAGAKFAAARPRICRLAALSNTAPRSSATAWPERTGARAIAASLPALPRTDPLLQSRRLYGKPYWNRLPSYVCIQWLARSLSVHTKAVDYGMAMNYDDLENYRGI